METPPLKNPSYRELCAEDTELLTEIQAASKVLLQLQIRVQARAAIQKARVTQAMEELPLNSPAGVVAYHQHELDRFVGSEPLRWAAIGKTDIQTGVMALVRAIVQPVDC